VIRDIVLGLPEEELREYVLAQRWYGSKSEEVASVRAVDAFPLRVGGEEPLLVVAVVEVRFAAGTHDLYNVPLGLRRGNGGFASAEGWSAFDALADDELVRSLVELVRERASVEHDGGSVQFCTVGGSGEGVGELGSVRGIGSEQSNTSVVLDERLVLKLYRRLEAGVNPELELLRFLTERDFPSIASLEGWAAHLGQPLDATLAILQQYVPVRRDGWTLALEDLAAGGNGFVPLVRRLGEVTGRMHAALASETSDPAFCPEEPSAEALALIVARIDEEIEQVFASLPDLAELEPLEGRADQLRDRLASAEREPVPVIEAIALSTAEDPAPPVPTVQADHAEAPERADLVLPDYDHLPAAHVVAKLVSLTPKERAAIEQYELAHRHRRTILGKIEQLRES